MDQPFYDASGRAVGTMRHRGQFINFLDHSGRRIKGARFDHFRNGPNGRILYTPPPPPALISPVQVPSMFGRFSDLKKRAVQAVRSHVPLVVRQKVPPGIRAIFTGAPRNNRPVNNNVNYPPVPTRRNSGINQAQINRARQTPNARSIISASNFQSIENEATKQAMNINHSQPVNLNKLKMLYVKTAHVYGEDATNKMMSEIVKKLGSRLDRAASRARFIQQVKNAMTSAKQSMRAGAQRGAQGAMLAYRAPMQKFRSVRSAAAQKELSTGTSRWNALTGLTRHEYHHNLTGNLYTAQRKTNRDRYAGMARSKANAQGAALSARLVQQAMAQYNAHISQMNSRRGKLMKRYM